MGRGNAPAPESLGEAASLVAGRPAWGMLRPVLRKVDTSRFDVAGAGDPAGSVFGLPYDERESAIVLVPVPWEATTSYGRGTVRGPSAIRAASLQLDLFDLELAQCGLGQPWTYGIHMRDESPEVRAWNDEACAAALPIVAAGGELGGDPALARALDRVNELSHRLDAWVEREVAALLAAGKIAGVVGGDHSVALGAIAAHAAHYGELGLLHIDAHADQRRAYEGFDRSHASVLYNALELVPGVSRVVSVGVRDLSAWEFDRCRSHPKIELWSDPRMRAKLADGTPLKALCDDIVDALPRDVYVTFDIDGLDPALCPGTGTPVPGGLAFAEATALLASLHRHGKRLVGFDLVEVAPGPEGGFVGGAPAGQWDGNVGARVLYKLCGWSLATRGGRD